MRAGPELWLILFCACSPPAPLRLSLDLPISASSAVVRMEASGEVHIAAVDLMTGDGAEALQTRKYLGDVAELSALAYPVPLSEVFLEAGPLQPLQTGSLLPPTSLRFARQSSPSEVGEWQAHPATDLALDTLQVNRKLPCHSFRVSEVPLPSIARFRNVRGLFALGQDRVLAATSDGQLHFVDAALEAPVSMRVVPRTNTTLQAAGVSPDGQIYVVLTPMGAPRPYQFLVGTQTSTFSALPLPPDSVLGDAVITEFRFNPSEPRAVYGLVDTGEVVRFDLDQRTWRSVLPPLRASRIYCRAPANDVGSPNKYCGGIFFEGGSLFAFDPAGQAPVRRLDQSGVTEERLLDTLSGGTVTEVAQTPLGLIVVRDDTLAAQLQRRVDGVWQAFGTSIAGLRVFTVAPVPAPNLVVFGSNRLGFESVRDERCKDALPTAPVGTNFGAAVATAHAIVVTTGDEPLSEDEISLVVYRRQ
ncbi:MAG: hypothetical protein U1E65_33190 [Myxococcota bacterium]